ncbi:dextranase [Cystobacter fuscus]|uniref:family 49 glycosyl hydrolase n=1 Tax=Cystobacter fuscus TaxID=43 RepID=UPI002B2A90E4|nr:dextranase [Cystobacter fuscus]
MIISFLKKNHGLYSVASMGLLLLLGCGQAPLSSDVGSRAQTLDSLAGHGAITGLSNKCVDLFEQSTAAGTQVHLWTCHSGWSQQWTANPVGHAGPIKSAGGSCLDVSDASTANGAKVQLWPCNGTAAQRWTLTSQGELKGPGGKCLDVEGANTADGTRLQLWECNGTAAQRWTMTAASRPVTADTASLKTWWHDHAELNPFTPVADSNVRRSTVYDVKVASGTDPQNAYDSFVYMSVPRGGREKWGYSKEDGAEFAKQAGLSMSWSSFLYGADAWVQIELKDGSFLADENDFIIRPTTLHFETQVVDSKTLRIRVPYSSKGYRFSVEFGQQLMTSYKDKGDQLTTDSMNNQLVHTEPRHAMLIFAEPMLSGTDVARLVPNPSSNSIYYPPQGEVINLDKVTEEVIYFQPGTYYMPWNTHGRLPKNVRWVYLAPGAYVKGAFQFQEGQTDFKVTGFGVLSGEKYVYEADTANEYKHTNKSECHGTCVKMLQFASGEKQQTLELHGITVAEPPYHTFVVYGYEDRFKMNVAQYKQIGSWYWQTDGIELYQGGTMKNSFVHSNDDVLKLYHSDLVVNDLVVWKAENGPVIQWGWVPRNIDNVHVKGVDIIHNRMHWGSAHNMCILNSARDYRETSPDSPMMGDPNMWVRNLFLEDIRSEGANLCAMRLYALANWENIKVKNLWIEEWNRLDEVAQASYFKAMQVTIGDQTTGGKGLELENYSLGNQLITRSLGNWPSNRAGRLNFDASLWNNWNAW